MSKDNVQLARDGYHAIASGDLEAVSKLLASDVRRHGGDPDAEAALAHVERHLGNQKSES